MANFTLQDGIDTITGTNGDDLFEGGTNGLQTGDRIYGRDGIDELRSGVIGQANQAPLISRVENIFLDTAGLPFDISNVTGARSIVSTNASIILEPIEEDDLRITFGAENVESGTVKLQFADGALSGDEPSLRLSSTDSNVTFTSDSTFDSTNDGEENATLDALRIDRIDIQLNGTQNEIDISAFTEVQTLYLSGDAETKVVVDSTELSLINASTANGGITITSDTATAQRVYTGDGNDDIKTGGGDDGVRSNGGDDVINLGGGNNTAAGGDGDDEIFAEAGDDRLLGEAGNDMIDAGSGNDIVRGGDGNDMILAGGGEDRVFGGAGDDDIRGGGGADQLLDGVGNDIVRGGGGRDVFFAGLGTDEFIGGGGVDTFLFNQGTFDEDTVSDFTLTSNSETNDLVVFELDGERQALSSQDSFEQFVDANPDAASFDSNTDTITIQADGGTITLEVSDADFLV